MMGASTGSAGERTFILMARFLCVPILGLVSMVALMPVSAAAQASRPAATSRPASSPAVSMPDPGPGAAKSSGPRPGLTVTPDDPIGPPGAVDVLALDAVNAMMTAMGGQAAFDNTSTLRFTFEVAVNDTVRSARTHWWDRRTNRYRIESKTREDKPAVTLFNLDTKAGDAWIDGVKAEGDDAVKQLESAYGRYINDTYWFLMPLKLFDPGVHLQMDGEALVHGSMCDRVKVTFDSVGLTPGDTYWAYIDRTSHRMVRWGFILQGDREKDAEPQESLYDWTDWADFGGLMLSATRIKVDEARQVSIRFRNIEAASSFSEKTFTDPAPLAP